MIINYQDINDTTVFVIDSSLPPTGSQYVPKEERSNSSVDSWIDGFLNDVGVQITYI